MKERTPKAAESRETHISRLEKLVDELLLDAPKETRVREAMTAVGLRYSTDPIERMNTVLCSLDGIRAIAEKSGEDENS